MSHDENLKLTGEQEMFASALAQLTPCGSALDRDAMMFQAGRMIARRGVRRWRGLTAALGLALAAVLLRPQTFTAPGQLPQSVEHHSTKMATEPQGAPMPVKAAAAVPKMEYDRFTPPALPPSRYGSNYLAWRNAVLTWGVDVLPAPQGDRQPVTRQQLLDELLNQG